VLITDFYFVFHKPAGLKEIRAGASYLSCFGHVEAFGCTIDDTWFFFDPGRKETSLRITHLYDEVNQTMAEKFTVAHEVIRIDTCQQFRIPLHLPMNCVTQCAALVGIRAFTPKGFRKKLLENKGVVINGTERGSSGC
jgi:hypothetical protein